MRLVLWKKTEAVNARLIKNRKENGVGGNSRKQSEGLWGVLCMYKVGLKWPIIKMALENSALCQNTSYERELFAKI